MFFRLINRKKKLTNTPLMKNINTTSILLFFLCLKPFCAEAQSNNTITSDNKIRVTATADNQKIHLQFKADTETGNLLVIVTDKTGETIFIDNHSHFKGEYERDIDLAETIKGEYSICVRNDESIYNEQILIR
jgi:hypothetical protein